MIFVLSEDIFFNKLDTLEQAKKYLQRARLVLAAIYNENLARYDWHARDPDEETCNQTVHIKFENEVGRLQNRIAHLENQMITADLDPNELRDLQEMVLDDDDDEIQFDCVMPEPIKVKKKKQMMAQTSSMTLSNGMVHLTTAQTRIIWNRTVRMTRKSQQWVISQPIL